MLFRDQTCGQCAYMRPDQDQKNFACFRYPPATTGANSSWRVGNFKLPGVKVHYTEGVYPTVKMSSPACGEFVPA